MPLSSRPLTTQTTASAPTPNLTLLHQHGLPTTLPPAPSLKRTYNIKAHPVPAPSSSAAQPDSIQHTLSFLPPSAHKAYQVLRNQNLRPPLPPLPSHSRAPATAPSIPLDSFDLEGLFHSADDIMLLQNKAFGFNSFSDHADLTIGAGPSAASQHQTVPLLDETLAQPPYHFDTFFEDPTPDLCSPLTSFSASPEWAAQPLFGDAGKEAGVVDDSPLFAAEDDFDFDFSGPSLFGDVPLFPPSKPVDPPQPSTTNAAFAALEASLAHLPVNPNLTLPKSSPALSFAIPAPSPSVPVAAPTSAVFSPSVVPQQSFFPPSPHRQSSSPFPTSTVPRPAPAVRRTSAPTGHRKGVEPKQLLDLDAPIQARNYVAPSATSRKRLPAAFEGRATSGTKTKKRKAAGDDASDEPSTSTTTDAGAAGQDPSVGLADSIEAKRKQNTLAARRSRIRKLEHVKNLERSVERLTADRDDLLRFAEMAMRMYPDLAVVDCWGARVATLRDEDGLRSEQQEEEMKRQMAEAFGEEEE